MNFFSSPANSVTSSGSSIKNFLLISHCFGSAEASSQNGDGNTLELLQHAINRGSRSFEFDLWEIFREKGGAEFVAVHGPYIQSKTSPYYRLPMLSFEEISLLRTTNNFRFPRLEDLICILPGDLQLFNIDLKGSSGGSAIAKRLYKLHREGKLPALDKIMISAFDHRELITFSRVWDELDSPEPTKQKKPLIGLLFSSIDPYMCNYAKNLGAYSLNLDDNVTEARIVHEARNLGLKVFVFTVNDLNRARELAAMGVDGIFTDRLDITTNDITDCQSPVIPEIRHMY